MISVKGRKASSEKTASADPYALAEDGRPSRSPAIVSAVLAAVTSYLYLLRPGASSAETAPDSAQPHTPHAGRGPVDHGIAAADGIHDTPKPKADNSGPTSASSHRSNVFSPGPVTASDLSASARQSAHFKSSPMTGAASGNPPDLGAVSSYRAPSGEISFYQRSGPFRRSQGWWVKDLQLHAARSDTDRSRGEPCSSQRGRGLSGPDPFRIDDADHRR